MDVAWAEQAWAGRGSSVARGGPAEPHRSPRLCRSPRSSGCESPVLRSASHTCACVSVYL